MPIIKSSDLPTFEILTDSQFALSAKSGQPQRTIAIVNMMPEAAIRATERQFIQLLGNHATAVKIELFHLDRVQYSETARQHFKRYYHSVQQLANIPHDALIISGANVPKGDITEAPFWAELVAVFELIERQQTPTLFSCLASHAAFEYYYQQSRQLLGNQLRDKCWGVFEHSEVVPHPLTANIESPMMVPHSRYNAITLEQLTESGCQPLIVSDDVGFHLAVSQQHPCFTFLQGHSEYNDISLLKEYKREIISYVQDGVNNLDSAGFPVCPQNYFKQGAMPIIEEFQAQLMQAKSPQTFVQEFPEQALRSYLNSNWQQDGKILFTNWLANL